MTTATIRSDNGPERPMRVEAEPEREARIVVAGKVVRFPTRIRTVHDDDLPPEAA